MNDTYHTYHHVIFKPGLWVAFMITLCIVLFHFDSRQKSIPAYSLEDLIKGKRKIYWDKWDIGPLHVGKSQQEKITQ